MHFSVGDVGDIGLFWVQWGRSMDCEGVVIVHVPLRFSVYWF